MRGKSLTCLAKIKLILGLRPNFCGRRPPIFLREHLRQVKDLPRIRAAEPLGASRAWPQELFRFTKIVAAHRTGRAIGCVARLSARTLSLYENSCRAAEWQSHWVRRRGRAMGGLAAVDG